MIALRIVCVLLVAVSGRAELAHQDHAVAGTIYREAVAAGHDFGNGISHSTPSGHVGHDAEVSHAGHAVSHVGHAVSHAGHAGHAVSHAGHAVSHAGPVVSHASHAVSHAGHAVSHAGPVVNHFGHDESHAVSHGGPVVSYAGPVVSHAGPVSYGGPVVSHFGHDESHAVSHAGPVVSHAGPVSYGGPVVSHAGPIVSHAGPVVSHAGPVVSHAGHKVSKTHVVHDAPVVHAPEVHAPVVSHGSGYYEPVRSQYHAQDAHGQYTFGYNAGTSARDETRDAYGNVRGSFSYIDSYGNLQTQHYVAGKDGFQVEGTNLPVQVTHDQRYKRSYATFPASTGPLPNGIPSGHVTTVTRHEHGPVVVGHQGSYGGPYGHGGAFVHHPRVAYNEGVAHAKAYGVSHLLGHANLDRNFDKYGYSGFSYGFETAPSSLTTYGTHFNQHIPSHPY